MRQIWGRHHLASALRKDLSVRPWSAENPGNEKPSASTSSAFSALCVLISSFRVNIFVTNYDVKLCASSFVALVPPAAANL